MNGSATSALEHFNQAYQLVHAPAVVVICLFGACSHTLTISVLARRPLFSPTNAVLISLSASQLCLCVNYLYLTLYKYYAESSCVTALWGYSWMFAFLVNVNFSVVFHTSGVFHVIGLSIVRYISIYHLAKMKNTRVPWFNFAKASVTIASIYVIVTILCVPFYLNSEVVPVFKNPDEKCPFEAQQLRLATNASTVAYEVMFSSFGKKNNLVKINFFLFGIGCKLFPCMVLLVMSCLLVLKLRELQAASANLLQYGNEVRGVRTYQRTTHLILAVMCIFVLVELPQGIVNLLAGIIGKKFDHSVQQNLADFFEMLTVLYSSVNFAIFCLMSGQFRTAFIANLGQLCPKWLLTKTCALARSNLTQETRDMSSGSGGGLGPSRRPQTEQTRELPYQSIAPTASPAKKNMVVVTSPDSSENNAASISLATANDDKERRPLMKDRNQKFKLPGWAGLNGAASTTKRSLRQPKVAQPTPLRSTSLMEITAL